MGSRYNVYFAGQFMPGQEPATVRANMARLFKANEATLDKLFSGKSQLVKRDCDKATALKYKQAIEQAGAVPVIELVAAPAPAPQAAEKPKMTAAERIAALAAAADLGAPVKETAEAPSAAPPEVPEEASQPEAMAGDIALAPAGTEVLRPEERPEPAASSVEAPQLQVDPSGERLSATRAAPPPAPDTSHLSEGEVGELLPNLPSSAVAVNPDTSSITLSPDGADFTDCAPPEPEVPDLDLSGIDLAPAGSEVLEPKYRRKQDTPPPPTDHLTLED